MAKQRTLDLDGKGLESRITLDSEAHGISENRKKGTEDLALKMTYSLQFSRKIKIQNKEKRKKEKKNKKTVAGTLCFEETQKGSYLSQ